ncbi:hypothetical protein FRC11_006552 [Ceratobasidium sp. 423]|nr:hypothetical protein FRC11_006552 [Ceratobasidium sp. 423]
MASVKELAARFESQTDPGTTEKDKRGSLGPYPSSYENNEFSERLTSTFIPGGTPTGQPIDSPSRSLPSLRAGLGPHDIEMRPLIRVSDCLTSGARKSCGEDALSGIHELGPLPPSQPARFLRRREDEGVPAKSTALDSAQPGEESTSLGGLSQSDHLSRAGTGQPFNPGIGKPNHSPETPKAHVASNDHKTIPITKLFARDAAPLHLPELDEWLGKLPRFQFTYPKANHLDPAPKPFPPLDLLKGERLKDLVHNSPPTPLWRDWNSIGSTITVVIGYDIKARKLSVKHNGTIPNVLALNFGGKLLQSISFLGILMTISGGLLFWFYKLTNRWSPNAVPEGLLSRDPARGTRAIPFVSFLLTVLYLPLSTVSVHAITWSSDFWPVENPYISTQDPDLKPLGPSSVFHDPLDFCWTTTMEKDEINYAPVAVILGILTLIFMTFWFPIRLGRTIRVSLPVVEPYDALGQRRSEEEMEHEYQRLLERDKSPFSFLYNGGSNKVIDRTLVEFLFTEYRRKWGSFKALYLGGKLTALLIVAIISPDSCLTLKIGRNHISRDTLKVARQSVLLAVMVAFLLVQSLAAPFVDPVSNANEWTSRMNFVLTSLLGLFVALDIPGQGLWNGWGLYTQPSTQRVYIITYGLTVYFTVINWGWMHRVIKRLTRRIDFGIDIFSPRLDISPESRHLKQRIWQESWTTLLLASPQCRMRASQKLRFAEGCVAISDIPAPPYLLDFANSPAERHIENLKILREIGRSIYEQAANESQIHYKRITSLRHKILQRMIGPDAFWFPTGSTGETCINAVDYFGNAWCTPFPLTVIIRYDSSGTVVSITNLNHIEEFIHQNESRIVEKQRELRIALRCLDSTIVQWPYTHTELVGNRFRWIGGRYYHAYQTTDHHEAKFLIRRQGSLEWNGVNLASGFDVSLQYSKKLTFDGSLIGLNVGLELTPQLARFLLLNKVILESRMPTYLNALRGYRTHALNEAESKLETLSYGFITTLYALPMDSTSVVHILAQNEPNPRVRDLPIGYEHAFQMMDERVRYVGQGPVEAWWFLFWVCGIRKLIARLK